MGDWVAELECGHNQHVRHRPPFQVREWVLDQGGRDARLGTPLPCPLCDRAELPGTVRPVRCVEWDEDTLPAGLGRSHRLGPGTWGRIRVNSGRLRFHAATEPPIEVDLDAGREQAIPPGVEHEVSLLGGAVITLEFLTVERGDGPGGDPACWASSVCPDCGGVAGDGSGHHAGCPSGRPSL